MADISYERQVQLVNDYKNLKIVFAEVDKKYNVNYNDIQFNFPESLGLEKLQFTPLTDSELNSIAEQAVAERFAAKENRLTSNWERARANLDFTLQKLGESRNTKVAKLYQTYGKNKDKATHNFVNNGLYRSRVQFDFDSKMASKTKEYSVVYDDQLERLTYANSAKFDNLTIIYDANKAALQEQKQLAINAKVKSLRDAQERKRISIEKYNNSVDEKEAKYKASCERAIQTAKRAEYNRAISAAKLYAQIGASGIQERKYSEKQYLAQWYFSSYTKAEAQFVMSLDGFLIAELGPYYSSFENWVNQNLH